MLMRPQSSQAKIKLGSTRNLKSCDPSSIPTFDACMLVHMNLQVGFLYTKALSHLWHWCGWWLMCSIICLHSIPLDTKHFPHWGHVELKYILIIDNFIIHIISIHSSLLFHSCVTICWSHPIKLQSLASAQERRALCALLSSRLCE